MATRTIDPFGKFLNQIQLQDALLQETLNDWDAIMNTGLSMVRDLEKFQNNPGAEPSLTFLKEAFSCGQGLTFLISNRFRIIKDLAEGNRRQTYDA